MKKNRIISKTFALWKKLNGIRSKVFALENTNGIISKNFAFRKKTNGTRPKN